MPLKAFKNQGTKILFVSACHSERVTKRLQEVYKIPIGICLKRDYTIGDVSAIEFATTLYDYLFQGYTVNESF